jgi:hypothetical protein
MSRLARPIRRNLEEPLLRNVQGEGPVWNETKEAPRANLYSREMLTMIKVTNVFFFSVLAFAGTAASAQNLEAVIDWSRWDAILRSKVIDGRVDYGAIAADPGFTATVADIANADLAGHDRQSLLAFSINAYNVLAVKGILDGHSPASSFGKLRFFYRDTYTIAGEERSLHAFENEHIRTLEEPRIHFAIVCASASCPPLRSEAYAPQTLDEQLDDNARRFLNDSAKNRYDLDSGVARISKIFKWFAEDFEATAGTVPHYIASFVDDEEVAAALRDDLLELRYLKYDWSLNGVKPSP